MASFAKITVLKGPNTRTGIGKYWSAARAVSVIEGGEGRCIESARLLGEDGERDPSSLIDLWRLKRFDRSECLEASSDVLNDPLSVSSSTRKGEVMLNEMRVNRLPRSCCSRATCQSAGDNYTAGALLSLAAEISQSRGMHNK